MNASSTPAPALSRGLAILELLADSRRGLTLSEIARRMELHCTAVGKVLMAYLPEEFLDRLIAQHGLPRHNDNTIASARKLKEHLKKVRALGYALDDEEDEVGFRCAAAPIMDDRGAVAAAVSVVGTTEEITAPRLPSLVEKVKATAAAISEVLRGNPPE